MATIDFYVNPGSGNDSNNGSIGSPYLTLAHAVSATGTGIKTTSNHTSTNQADLVSNGNSVVIHCASSDGTADTGGVVNFTGWTTGASNTITLQNDDDHGGAWNTSAYRLQVNSTYVTLITIGTGCEYFVVDGLQLEMLGDTALDQQGIVSNISDTTSSLVTIKNNIVKCRWGDTPSATSYAIRINNGNVNVVNNIMYGDFGYQIYVNYTATSGVMRTIYSNTVYGGTNGIRFQGTSTTTRAFNNIASNTATADYVNLTTQTTHGTNGSEDTTGDTSYQSMSFPFTNTTAGSEDFQLTGSTSSAGTDLSADSDYAFSDDINGTTRVTWDLGADEFVVSGTTIEIPTGPWR